MTFRTRVSVWLIVIIVAAFAVPPLIAFHDIAWIEMAIDAGVCLVLVLALFGIRYRIDGNTLYVGNFFSRGSAYDLTKLVSITSTRTVLSAPASSISRIELDFGCGDALVISPAAQNVFIDEILRINPNVTVSL